MDMQKKTKRIWHPQTAETSKFVSLVLPANVTKRHKTKTPQPSLQSSQRDAINDDVSHQTFFSKIAMTICSKHIENWFVKIGCLFSICFKNVRLKLRGHAKKN